MGSSRFHHWSQLCVGEWEIVLLPWGGPGLWLHSSRGEGREQDAFSRKGCPPSGVNGGGVSTVWWEAHDAVYIYLVFASHGPSIFKKKMSYQVWARLIDGPSDEWYG